MGSIMKKHTLAQVCDPLERLLSAVVVVNRFGIVLRNDSVPCRKTENKIIDTIINY